MEKIKFKKDSNIIKLHDEVYLYKNFIKEDQLKNYHNQLLNFPEEEWYKHENYEPGDLEGDYWNGKLSLDIIDGSFHNQIVNYFAPDFWPYQHTNFIRLLPGESAEGSFPIYDFIDYKLAIYLGEWEGGELCFPELNIEYKPEHNDLIFFKSSKEYKHFTKPVLSGARYAYIDFLVKHPGYFMA